MAKRLNSVQVKVKQLGPPACATYGDPMAGVVATANKAKLRKAKAAKIPGIGRTTQSFDVGTTLE